VAQEFYARLLGRPPDLVPNEREAAWQLHAGAWIVLIADAQAAGGALHTLILPELDPLLTVARAAGIEPGPVEPVGEGLRQTIIVDPDGNRLKVAAPRLNVAAPISGT
jgi:hypothetical protein